MSIKRGTSNIKQHARNFPFKQAHSRMDSCVEAYQNQGINALGVNFHEIEFYQKAISTQVCTCKQVEKVVHSREELIQPVHTPGATIVIDPNRPLFGNPAVVNTPSNSTISQDYINEFEIVGLDEEESTTVTNLFGADAECGICYRGGFLPGFTHYGWIRSVFEATVVEGLSGFYVEQSHAPNTFQNISDSGWVLFSLTIPKYYKTAYYSIRNNLTILQDNGITDNLGSPITDAYLRFNAGKTVRIKVVGESFTHLVVEFDLGIPSIHANLSQLSRSLNWDKFESLGNIDIVLPATLNEVRASDIIYVSSLKLTLKITDTPYLRTSLGKSLDWDVTTRVIQPQEPIKQVFTMKKI